MCVYKINKSAQLGELCTYCKLASVDFERNLLDQWFSNWISMTVFLKGIKIDLYKSVTAYKWNQMDPFHLYAVRVKGM